MTEAEFAALRVKMVDGQVRTTDVTDNAVLDAMLEVPRELFVPASMKALAYIDEDLLVSGAPGNSARYLMEPSPFAKLLQLAVIGRNDFVLDVGAATGYSSAVISRIAGSVIALESDAGLAAQAEAALAQAGCDNVVVVKGDLTAGCPRQAPFDVIFVGGAVGYLPEALTDQLKEGGRLVVVEGQGNGAVARLYIKEGGVAAGRRAFNAAVKPLSGFERVPEFQF